MPKAYDLYKQQTAQVEKNSLYSGVQSPFSNFDPTLPQSLALLNRKLPSTPQQKLKDPVDATLKDLNISSSIPEAPQDNTRVVQPEAMVPKMLTPPVSPFKKGFDLEKFRNDTIKTESGGNANATNKTSSAQGKYQFLWGTWGDSIQKVTGMKSPDEFRANPKAQDQFFDFYTNKVVLPEVNRLRPLAEKQNLSDNDLARIVHFRGAAGAMKALKENLMNVKLEKGNMTINRYLGR